MNTFKKRMNGGAILVSFLLVLIMTLTPFFLNSRVEVYGETRVPELLSNLEVEIVDGLDEDGNLRYDEPFEIKVSFGVPVEGDGGEAGSYFNHGDEVEILLSRNFSFINAPKTISLISKGVTIGTVVLTNNVDGESVAKIIFDGEEEVFSGDSGWSNVKAGFEAWLEFDSEHYDEEIEDPLLQYIEKDVIFIGPGKTVTIEVTKQGELLEYGVIKWTVSIVATRDTIPVSEEEHVSLAGYDFIDDLTYVGEFVTGSFSEDENLEPVGKIIRYTFPDDTDKKSPYDITFNTKVSDGILSAGGDVFNTGAFVNGELEFPSNKAKVTIEKPNFVKDGSVQDEYNNGSYNPSDRTITWYVLVDTKGLTLKNLKIKDVLQGTTLESAIWQVWSGNGSGEWQDKPDVIDLNSPPEDNTYVVGDFTGLGRLKLVVKVPDAADGLSVGKTTYYNQAFLTWGDETKPDTDQTNNKGVPVGYDTITKTGAPKAGNPRQIDWTIKVDLKGQGESVLSQLAVYDLIVPDSKTEDTDLADADGWPPGLVIGTNGVVRQNGHKLVAGSQSVTSDLVFNAIDLSSNGKYLGTLIKVTGLKNDAVNEIKFTTQVVDPGILAGNGGNRAVKNTASLFKTLEILGSATGTVNIDNKILSKQLLHRAEVGHDHDGQVIDANRTADLANGFHYGYKEAIFRLNVNEHSLDFDNAETTLDGNFGKVTVTDTLPAGWEFSQFKNGRYFKLYQAEIQSGSLKATGEITDLAAINAILTFEMDTAANVATFTFESLTTPYVILVKAGPTPETLEGYLKTNKPDNDLTNTLKLETENWKPGKTVQQLVRVDSTVIEKFLHIDDQKGIAKWWIDYTPLDQKVGTGWQDKIPEGVDLRTDSSGQLIFVDDNGFENISVFELVWNEDDGKYQEIEVSKLSLEDLEKYVNYNADGRLLEFEFPDKQKAYRLVYYTDITGAPGSVSNKVALIGELVGGATHTKGFAVTKEHGWATMSRMAFIALKKTASDGWTPLEGAEFTLYNTDDEGNPTSVRAIRATDDDGSTRFYGLPEGHYVLEETGAPQGYEPDDTLYEVIVGADRSVIIDGRLNGPQRPLTVRNFTANELFGDLTLRKIVAGNAGDPDALFTFTIHLLEDGEEIAGVFNYLGFDGAPNGTISSGGKVYLKDGQWIGIFDLPEGIDYVIEEDEADPGGYVITSEGAEGVISDEEQSNAIFTNTRNLGELTIKKTIDGISGDKNRKFTFVVTLTDGEGEPVEGEFAYEGQGVEGGEIASGGIIMLADGESIIIRGLPIGSSYTVVELEADKDDYITTATGDTGSFGLDDFEKTAQFINSRNLGELTIKKTVNGLSGDKTRKFTFEVTLTDPDGQAVAGKFTYEGQGVEDGEIVSGGTVKLADGESIVIRDLPVGSSYTVVELEADEDDYITTPIGDKGSFELDDLRKTAQFINTNNTAVEGDEDIPKTGDATNILWLALFVISLTLLIALKGADTYMKRERSTK